MAKTLKFAKISIEIIFKGTSSRVKALPYSAVGHLKSKAFQTLFFVQIFFDFVFLFKLHRYSTG